MTSADRVERLVRETAPDLLAYFERRVEPREDAADLLADTLVVAWRRHPVCPDSGEQGRMWLFTIARNVLANHRRGIKRRHALAQRLRQHVATVESQSTPVSDTRVHEALADLPEDMRELVRLVHWDGFTASHAGQILGINPSTARSRYSVAKGRLRDYLQHAPAERTNMT